MAIELEYASLREEFGKVGATLVRSKNHSKLRVTHEDNEEWFRLPQFIEENNQRLPGWFLAGVWDLMQLPDANEVPGSILLPGWGFSPDAGLWRMNIGEVQQLVYNPSSGGLYIQNYSSGSTTDVGAFPTRSIFHAQKLFEENGWFRGESLVKSLDVRKYLLL